MVFVCYDCNDAAMLGILFGQVSKGEIILSTFVYVVKKQEKL